MFLDYKKPFIIAEIGSNHEGNFDYAVKLLKLAIASGADAIKFQAYEGDKIVSSVESKDRNAHFKKLALTTAQHIELAKITQASGKVYMCSVWDQDNLNELDAFIPIHKIGSGDLTNYPILAAIAAKNKPIILSTAMATLPEIKDAFEFIRKCNPGLVAQNKVAILQCVAMYGEPKDEYANLNSIKVLQDSFPGVSIGYSDHTVGTYACELALALGASILEIHFTDDKTRSFRDHQISVTCEELQGLVAQSERIGKLMGRYEKIPIAEIESEQRIKEFRRAVYLKRDCPKGTIIKETDLITLRPNQGIDARNYQAIIGKELLVDRKAFEALKIADFK